MGTARFVAVLLVLAGVGLAQDKESSPHQALIPTTPLDRYELPPSDPKQERLPVQAGERLAAVLRLMFSGEDAAAGKRAVRPVRSVRGPLLLVMGKASDVALAQSVVEQLAKEEPLRARLQCSLVALPLPLAREQGLVPAVVTPADEAKLGELMRAAAKSGGALHNLPEVMASPLRPFAVAVAAKAAVPEEQRLRVRGEMVPASATEVAVHLHLVRGALPAELTSTPEKALLQPIVRLEAGKAVMVMAVEGDTATVMIVRCVELSNAPLPKADAR